ncbi:hypothetical protein Mapa_011768 [Marchantia paleacea]|nr:hypothetical protein Mapa_011768 [Marchantia paleacea]
MYFYARRLQDKADMKRTNDTTGNIVRFISPLYREEVHCVGEDMPTIFRFVFKQSSTGFRGTSELT